MRVEGVLYPIKEAFATVSGLDLLDFNTNQARNWFRKLGFEVLRVEQTSAEVEAAQSGSGKRDEADGEQGMSGEKKRAVVLLSGGADSTTALAVATREGYATYALSFRYGQRHKHELECAVKVARYFNVVEHVTFDVNIGAFGGSALTADIDVPKDRAIEDMEHDIPVTYVPARNTVFLSIALAWAEVLGANDIFIGVNALDYSGYPDCRPEYIEAYRSDGKSCHEGWCRGAAEAADSYAADSADESADPTTGTELGSELRAHQFVLRPERTR